MKIDLRVTIPFVLPFVILATFRLLWLFGGADWNGNAIVVICAISGFIAGCVIAFILFVAGVSIGTITISRNGGKK
jgi:hypothetical protein